MPRWAFDQMATAMGGQRFLGGETVYVLHGTDEVRILRDAVAGAVPHRLVTSRGRLLFAARGAAPFVPGSRYSLQVSAAGIRLDLSAVAA